MTDNSGDRTIEEERQVEDAALAERLGRLPREAAPIVDLWPGLVTRIAAGPRWQLASPIVQAAAAAVLFVAGLGSGLAIAGSRTPHRPPEVASAMQLASEVQRTGTEYVAALAAFGSVMDSLSSDIRLQGREAALATLFGAAQEMATLTALPAGEVGSARDDQEGRAQLPVVRF